MKVFVDAPESYIGRHIVQKLRELNHEIVSLSNSEASVQSIATTATATTTESETATQAAVVTPTQPDDASAQQSALAPSSDGATPPAAATTTTNDASSLAQRILALSPEAIVVDLTAPTTETLLPALLSAFNTSSTSASTESPLILLGVSTLMTWNATSKNTKKTPLVEQNYAARKCTTAFKQIKQLETVLLSANSSQLATCVLGSGVTYGHGESELHELFRCAWLSEMNSTGAASKSTDQDELQLQIVGDGKNVIPLIHITDLASIVGALITNGAAALAPQQNAESEPQDDDASQQQQSQQQQSLSGANAGRYVVAVDQSTMSQKQIVQSISQGLRGHSDDLLTLDKTDERVLLNHTQMNSELALNCDLRFVPTYIHSLGFDWHSPAGLLQSSVVAQDGSSQSTMDALRLEYIRARRLVPLRLVVTGAPLSGKSTLAAELAKRHYLPLVELKSLIQQTLDRHDEMSERVAKALALDESRIKQRKLTNANAATKGGAGKQTLVKKPVSAASSSAGAGAGALAAPGTAGAAGKKGSVAGASATATATTASAATVKYELIPSEQPRLPTWLLCRLVKQRLTSPECRNKGYVLDGFPRSKQEARLLFGLNTAADGDEEPPIDDTAAAAASSDDAASGDAPPPETFTPDPAVWPDRVLSLDSISESICQQHAQQLSDDAVVTGHSDLAGLTRRTNNHHYYHAAKSVVDRSPLTLFAEAKRDVLELDAETLHNKTKRDALLVQYCNAPLASSAASGGAASAAAPSTGPLKRFNYHPNAKEIAAQQQSEREAKSKADAEARQLAERQAQLDKEESDKLATEYALRRELLTAQDASLISAASAPLRSYLLAQVMPALIDGLLDTCKQAPSDPVEHLAQFLIQRAVQLQEQQDAKEQKQTPQQQLRSSQPQIKA